MKRVLIVDDEVDVVESMVGALAGYCEVLTANDGKAALELVERESIDAIVVDLMMPVMTGEELITELAARGITIPVVVASASQDVEARCKLLGVEHCLQKPYRLGRLIEQLDRVIAPSRVKTSRS